MRPIFNGTPIASVDALARSLSLSAQQLRTLAGAVSGHYRDFDIPKRDGSFRTVSGPTEELKIIQRRINRHIFERVQYPSYLFGSIKERNYVQNARSHSRAHVIVAMDVENFFPSIKREAVLNIFKNLFRFPQEVASLLADLCTKDGHVPQGACTSSYIANLALHDIEHRLVSNLRHEGLIYSRLTDDISISSPHPLAKKRIESLVVQVAEMLKCKGFKPKRRKTKVTSKNNSAELMEVTGLWLNLGEPRVKRDERASIRTEVRRCIRESKVERTSPEFHKLHDRTSGRVAMLSQLKHREANRFRVALRLCAPLYSPIEIKRTQKIVAAVCKTPLRSRETAVYIQRFYQARYRVNIVSRTDPKLAKELHARLSSHVPKMKKEEAIYG
ncbi:reverse transcriptase family protein [Vitreoscilla filiformis]|nr:reverse transcriptase family protein [Vitreoscilla filiformis]